MENGDCLDVCVTKVFFFSIHFHIFYHEFIFQPTDSHEVLGMTKKARRKMTGDLIVEILVGAAKRQSRFSKGIVICVENAQWMDAKSIRVFDKISEIFDRNCLWIGFSFPSGELKNE